jgi:prolyl-tRNA editing enzyme YbaK/EbsC (Cys-tRNA(Pro) deacylase)
VTALHPSCQAVNDILATAGLPGRVRILGDAAPTARAAAEQVGCPVGAIANSLIFAADGSTPLLIMTSGAHRVDVEKVGLELGTTLHRASAEFVREHTGQPIGGVAPIGHPRPIRTLVDVALAEFDELWAAGGIPHAVFPISYPDLLALTRGTEITVAD